MFIDSARCLTDRGPCIHHYWSENTFPPTAEKKLTFLLRISRTLQSSSDYASVDALAGLNGFGTPPIRCVSYRLANYLKT